MIRKIAYGAGAIGVQQQQFRRAGGTLDWTKQDYPARLAAAQASLASAEATHFKAQADQRRQTNLPKQATSQQDIDSAESALRASDARMRFTLLSRGNAAEIADELYAKFERREKQEVARVHQVYAVASSAPCVTNALAAHFGEIREQPCGHCSACLEGPTMKAGLPPRSEKLPESFPRREWQAVRMQAGAALAHPRNAAKFLCGLTSPGLTKAKLSRHPLFGSLETVPFHAILRFCEVPAPR